MIAILFVATFFALVVKCELRELLRITRIKGKCELRELLRITRINTNGRWGEWAKWRWGDGANGDY
jgi:hypothetical protein